MPNPQLLAKIARFRQLHSEGGLLLANAWDLMTARLAEHAGYAAIATTSAGVSWTLGSRDNQSAPRKLAMQQATAIASATTLPVSMDLQNGLLEAGETMADLVDELIAAGVVGVNIEDANSGTMLSTADAASRLEQLRAAADAKGYPLFINARMDAYFRGECREADGLIARARAYVAAGADGIFIPFLQDLDLCREIADAIVVPLNVLALPGGPGASQLFAAGVRRLSAGSFLVESAYGQVLDKMRTFRRDGVLQAEDSHLAYAALDQLLA
ncbi:isocitrate lyase/phosphoenolpyruvate mutase family protein [Chitinimonas sp.]|uniref:isocitrate lyase/PEP mutase family protein n=1 Tax=Chitinimonas sp. TaxID=1934313 RepID=UPI0035ADD222